MRRTQLRNEDDPGFPKLSAPARRALSGAGYTRLDQLSQISESELKQLHGMGPTAIEALREALRHHGHSFHSSVRRSNRPAESAEAVDEYLRA